MPCRVSDWRKDAKTLLLAFVGAVLGGIGAYVGSLIVNDLKLIQLEPADQVIAALVVSMIVGYSLLVWVNVRLRRALSSRAPTKSTDQEKPQAPARWEFFRLHEVTKVLDKVREELVVSQWWPDGTTVKIEATSSDNMDFALKFAQTESAPLQPSEDHSQALTIWGVSRTKKLAREFETEIGAGVWYAVAA